MSASDSDDDSMTSYPVIHVTGDAYVGAVTVQVKAPREKILGHLGRKFLGK